MQEAVLWALASVVLVSLLSLVGAISLSFGALRKHGVALALVALAAGTLMGDTFLHILPEASAEHGFTGRIGALVLVGFLSLFVLEVGLRWRHGHAEHLDDPHHDHGHGHTGDIQPFGWVNLVGDAVHNLLDGAVIAAAYLADIHLGYATTIAVVLHEIPQELGDFAVLVRSGMAPAKALLFNLGSALFALFGAAAVLLAGLDQHTIEGLVLPLIAGAFIYIAAADLVPELHHHTDRRETLGILALFLLGLALMWLVGLAEPGHAGHSH